LARQIRTKCRHILFELAEDQERAALAQQRMNGKVMFVAVLIPFVEKDLAVSDRRPGAVAARRAAARLRIAEVHVDERLAYAVAKAEMLHAIRRANGPTVLVDLVGVFAELDMQDLDAERQAEQRQDGAQGIAPPVGAGTVVEGADIVAQPPAQVLQDRLVVAVDQIAAGEIAVHAIEPEDSFPVLRRARSNVAQPLGPRRHALLEGLREGGERRLAQLQGLQPGEGEGDIDWNRVPLLLGLVTTPQACFFRLAAQQACADDTILRRCLRRCELSDQFVGECTQEASRQRLAARRRGVVAELRHEGLEVFGVRQCDEGRARHVGLDRCGEACRQAGEGTLGEVFDGLEQELIRLLIRADLRRHGDSGFAALRRERLPEVV
jgi:hypothetical protein